MSDRNLTVSAIIPTYNRAAWLDKCIKSVLNQASPVDEIILIDDGSTDNTAQLIEKYPQINYHYQENMGPSAARNAGARIAKGHWLAFLDSDDEWVETKLKRQREYLIKNPNLKVVYTNEIWVRNGVRVNQKKKHKKFGGKIYNECLPLCIISPSSILINKQLFSTLKGFDETFPACEDYELWLRLSLREQIGFIDEPLIIKQGGHADQLSRQWGLDQYRLAALEKMLATSELQGENRKKTILEAINRCQILVTGHTNRNKHSEAVYFHNRLLHWQTELNRFIGNTDF